MNLKKLHTDVYDILSLPKSKLQTKGTNFPLSGLERDRLSQSMTVEELVDATLYHEDEEAKPKRRWREIQHLFQVTRDPRFNKRSIENALWFYAYNGVSANHFVNAITQEFQFPPELKMEPHLRWLYWSFDNGTNDRADWRSILASFRIIIFFRLIKKRPVDLLISCFDIYAVGGEGRVAQHPNEAWYVTDAVQCLTDIFILPCEALHEIGVMRTKIRHAMLALYKVPAHQHEIHVFGTHVMYRKEFRQFLRQHEELVTAFADQCWARCPVDLRLQAFDEEQSHAQERSDIILVRFKLVQAYAMYTRHLYRDSFNTWRAAAKALSVVRQFAIQKYIRRRRGYFRFWRSLTSRILLRRRRKLLAEVMGNYALKARTFGRIRLYGFQTRYISRTAGRFNKFAKREKMGFMHLRNYVRLSWLRKAFHIWWNEAVQLINWDLAVEHDWHRRLRQPVQRWFTSAHYDAMNKRIEMMALENKFAFDRMMKEADEQALEIVRIEKENQEKRRIAEEAKEVIEKQKNIEAAKHRKEKAKKEDEAVILATQREIRRRRVKLQMKRVKTNFVRKLATKKDYLIDAAKRRITAYLANPENDLAVQLRFEKLKREFFEAPCSENREREAILTSHKNIVFLFLDAKLKADNLELDKVVRRFDKENKGFLTHDAFKAMVKALGIRLTHAQLTAVIRGVDPKGDGAINLDMLLESMRDIKRMGVVGSPWKMYVDPAQDVICYHNFVTGEKVYEYQVTDELLKQINISNLYGDADTQAREQFEEAKKKDWEDVINNLMVRRLQWMYRQWKLRKKRRAKLWDMQSRIATNRRRIAQKIVTFLEKLHTAAKVRELFKRELCLTYQKVYEVNDGRIFWFNHLTKTAAWERPHLLWRYGDVGMPNPWSPIDVPLPSLPEVIEEEGDRPREQLFALHYWHVKAKRDLPRKPDGLPICVTCRRNLAAMRCVQCTNDFCFTCYRDTHASPFGFFQKRKPNTDEAQDMNFLVKLKYSREHTWTDVTVPRCGLCKTQKIAAGMHCSTCNLDLCRPCCRRIHERGADQHEFWPI